MPGVPCEPGPGLGLEPLSPKASAPSSLLEEGLLLPPGPSQGFYLRDWVRSSDNLVEQEGQVVSSAFCRCVGGGAKRRDGVWFRPSHSIWALPPPQTPLGPETASPVCPGRSSHSALVPKGPGYSERQRDSVFPSPPLSQPPSPLCLILNLPTFGLRAESLFLPVRLASPPPAGRCLIELQVHSS